MRPASAFLIIAGLALVVVMLGREDPPTAGSAARDQDAIVTADRITAATIITAYRDEPADPTTSRYSAAPVDAATDPGWSTLPRLTRDLVGRLLQTQQCDPTQLYRSLSFNPRDIWLEPPARHAIASIVEDSAARLQRLRVDLVAARDREFAALHAEGQVFAVDLTTIEGLTNLRNAGSEPVFADIDGRTLVAARVTVPDTAAAATALQRAIADLCVQLAHAFAGHGTLHPSELEAIVAAAAASTGTTGR